ncbi:MAG: 23S rRNA (uracil(1939)-C(5))-methyltransferase RlmD [Slackia sp.]|nr:23S rRNA (uracil(1939)-C(5))-methyltransferase RlmD [Slackia sp.]
MKKDASAGRARKGSPAAKASRAGAASYSRDARKSGLRHAAKRYSDRTDGAASRGSVSRSCVSHRTFKPNAEAIAAAEASKKASAHSARRDGLFCPIDGRCGGCELLRVPYKKQLKEKQERMEALFCDLVDSETKIAQIVGMRDPRYYRNKVVSPYVAVYDRRARKRRILCGMYERGTHRVIDSRECLIENQEAKRIILTVRELMGNFGMTPYDEDADTGFLRHVQVRVGHTSGEVMVTLITREEPFPASRAFVRALKKAHPCITTVVQNVNTRKTNVIMGEKERTLYGPGFILDSLCGLTFRISSKSFYQVNSDQTEVLYTRAIEMARLSGVETVMDAYCGTGTIGLVAARGVNGGAGAARVVGVEERPDAVADARNNAAHNGIEAAEFVAADAGAFMRDVAARGEHIDVLLMDPPRSGSTPDFLKAACSLAPRCIVYISCNPETQRRDAEYLTRHGYRIAEMQPVDMFPHTHHVENILAFERVACVGDSRRGGSCCDRPIDV